MKKIISNIKEKIQRQKTLIHNFSYLSALQLFNMLLPLITYPYLIRVLGAEQYGFVIYAQVISTYLGILIDFGFSLSSTKDISIHRDDKKKLSEIVSSVFIIKLILWLVSFGLLFIMVILIPAFKSEKLLFLFSFGLCFNEFLFPQWYFQGIERMKYITIINLIARIFFLVLIFIVVREKSDYIFVPVLNGIGALIGGLLGIYVVFVKDKIKLIRQPISKLIYYFKESSPLFGSNLIISIKDKFNIILIGATLGMRDVVIYDLSIKIMTLFIQPIQIINTTIYPKIAKERNMKFMLYTTKLTLGLVLGVILLIQPFLSSIINFLGKDLHEAIWTTRILLISPLIMVWSLSLAINCINALGRYILLLKGMIYTSMFYMVLIAAGYYFNLIHSLMFFVVVTVIVYLFELLYRIYVVRKYSLIEEK